MARVKGTVIYLMGVAYPLRFRQAPTEQSHLSVPLGPYFSTDRAITPLGASRPLPWRNPLWGATQLCAALDEGQGAQFHVLSSIVLPSVVSGHLPGPGSLYL